MSCSAFGGPLARRASLSRNCFVLGLVLCSEQNGRGLRNFHYHPILLSACPSVRRPGACPTCPTDRHVSPFLWSAPRKNISHLSLALSLLLLLPAHSSHPSSDLSSLSFSTFYHLGSERRRTTSRRASVRPPPRRLSTWRARRPRTCPPMTAPARPLTRLIGLHNLRLQRRRRRRIGTC